MQRQMGDVRIFEYQTFKAIAGFDPGTFGQKQTKQHYGHNCYVTCSNFLSSRLPHTEPKGEKNTKKISIETSNKDDLEQKGEKNTKKISMETSNKNDLK